MNPDPLVIAFDLDGTLSKHASLRNLLRQLDRGNLDIGNRVLVLTAAAGELPPSQRPSEVRKRLRYIGVEDYTELVCVEQHEKGAWCAANNVDILIDDSECVIKDVQAKSPRTLCLKVC